MVFVSFTRLLLATAATVVIPSTLLAAAQNAAPSTAPTSARTSAPTSAQAAAQAAAATSAADADTGAIVVHHPGAAPKRSRTCRSR